MDDNKLTKNNFWLGCRTGIGFGGIVTGAIGEHHGKLGAASHIAARGVK